MHTLQYLRPAGIALGILLIPLIAMQFTEEVQWTFSDFLIMGILLFVTGVLVEFSLMKGGKYKLLVTGLIVLAFLWLYAELAVGIFTNWGS